ncbi:hypothetical protein EDB85DRAFT_1900256 [Lactarius pseudohatsudake]|nr:hypothetical protein EDB85DRAFT_1900256 [Lactarius pseudohatsudake]
MIHEGDVDLNPEYQHSTINEWLLKEKEEGQKARAMIHEGDVDLNPEYQHSTINEWLLKEKEEGQKVRAMIHEGDVDLNPEYQHTGGLVLIQANRFAIPQSLRYY